MEYPFERNRDGDSNTAGHADHVFMKERLATPRRRTTRMRLLIKIVWAGIQYGLKEYIAETVGGVVVVWIRK